MIQKLKIAILPLLSLFVFAAPLALSSATAVAVDNTGAVNQSQITGDVCTGSQGDLGASNQAPCNSTSVSTFNTIIKWVLNILSIIVGVIAVIMIIVAGLKYVTSGGKEEGVKGAKNTILYAVIGLVIVALAQVIVHFVLTTANQQVVTQQTP